ncbi:DUF2946 family protein [Methylocapsa polymorpha]|uniref:DUF2946 family protein n=1 Tax=Methylocapsa polymorpha TaxID=3080828 RepID=UPI003890F373
MIGQAADPLGHVILCSPNGGGDAGQSTPSDIPHHHDHCPLCQIVCGNLGFLEARPVSVATPYAEARCLFWTLAPDRAALFGVDQHSPPRGPPSLA